MWECRYRIFAIEDFVEGNSRTLYPQTTIEFGALQLRKLLELIAFASLVSYRDAYAAIRSDIAKDWHAERILKKISNINVNFYPVPVRGHSSNDWIKIRGGFLTRTQFASLYDHCSSMLHVKNPFAKGRDVFSFNEKVPEYISRIKELLVEHMIQLAKSDESFYVKVPMNEHEPIQVAHLIYDRTTPNQSPKSDGIVPSV